MLRIWTEHEGESGGERRLHLRLEGQVRGAAVAELARVAEDAIGRGLRIEVDLGGVTFLDPSGVALLRSLRTRRVDLSNCSPFTAEQLRS
jgi:ABC-type transporter Mla MlaB component